MTIKELVLRAAVLAAAVFVGGCATAYQPRSFSGGFSETDLGPTSFRISFAGNGFTSPERASDFAMLRAADKSIEDGCSYFNVMNESEGGSTSSITTSTASFGRYGVWGTSFTTPIFKPDSTLLVRCFMSQAPGSSLFDAHFIAHSIRAKYGLPGAAGQEAAAATVSYASPAVPSQAEPENPVPAAPATNIAQQVLAAQRVAGGQGCGDVTAAQDGTFQASCPAGTLIIQCDGASCAPARMKRD